MIERRIVLPGGEITFLEEDRSSGSGGPVVLYIHGNLGCRLWFSEVMDIPGCRVLAPDMPNFGDSYGSGDFSMAGYAVALEEFLAGMDVTGAGTPVVIVGHSLGGVVAMEMAARTSVSGLSIAGMVLVSPGPIEGLMTPKEYYPVIEMYRTDRNLLKTALATVVPALKDETRLDELVEQGMKMHPGAFTGHPDELAAADYRERLGGLPYPVLIIRGESDMLITREMGEGAAAHLGGEYREPVGVGHSPMVENPPLFVGLLKAFLEKIDGC